MLAGLGALDLSKADALFDPDKLAEIAAESIGDDRHELRAGPQDGHAEGLSRTLPLSLCGAAIWGSAAPALPGRPRPPIAYDRQIAFR